MLLSKSVLASLMATGLVNAAVIYQQLTSYAVVTADPTDEYITVTASNYAVKTVESTIEETTTLYRATTKPVTLYTGTIVTILSTVEPNRVQPAETSSVVSLSQTLEPTSYTAPIQITPAQSATTVTPTETPTPTTTETSTTEAVVSSTFATVLTTSSSAVAVSSAPVSSAQAAASSSSAAAAAPSTSSSSSGSSGVTYSEGTDIFGIISSDEPPSVFPKENLDITLPSGVPTGSPIQTNKFYTNFILGDQTYPAYVQPYSVWWSKLEKFPGLGISHTNDSQRVYGPDASANPVEYYINPVGLISLAFSAADFTDSNMALSVSNLDTFSVTATLSSSTGSIDFPLVQGMGFVTAKYDGKLTPLISTQLGIDTFVQSSSSPSSSIQKYVATLFNGISWVIYVTLPSDSSDFSLSVDSSSGSIVGSSNAQVIIQVASVPTGTESYYDQAAGMYPVSGSVSGTVGASSSASYAITFNTEGSSECGSTLMMALPHHVESFSSSTSSKATSITLDSTNKGVMTGYLTNSFEFQESLNQEIQFLPWSSASAFGSGLSYSADALTLIATVANSEIEGDIGSQTNLDSTYFSGKAFDKFAYILLVINDVLKNSEVSQETLDRLKTAFSVFTSNEQQTPLMYDTLLKGVTSASGQDGDSSADFGSPYYNDHHFHYGYFIHTAAVIGYVDKQYGGTWAEDNKAWVNSLVRDVANPSSDDSYFPVFRSFDWFSGHSWAKGMFASSDGKDEESSSEDYNFSYGMKLWGKVIGDSSMEARGDLMISVMRRSMNDYFYMQDDNTIQPSNFIANKVPGITFENKLDHITYFGTNVEYIQGIHMIPITPVSSYLRQPEFVEQEWNSILSSLVGTLNSGWVGILRLNQALFDPKSSYEFFAQSDFSSTWLDGGASRTWCLAFSAGVGGSQA